MFEQEQAESAESVESVRSVEPATEKKLSSVVLLAAGGVLVATVCATLASMLATGSESKPEAGPPKAKAEVEVDQPSSTSTSISVAPDGSTATVVITVPGSKAKGEQAVRNAAGPGEGEVAPEVVETSVETRTSAPRPTRRPVSSSPAVPSSSSVAVTTSSSLPSVTAPPVSGEPGKP